MYCEGNVFPLEECGAADCGAAAAAESAGEGDAGVFAGDEPLDGYMDAPLVLFIAGVTDRFSPVDDGCCHCGGMGLEEALALVEAPAIGPVGVYSE